jgi:hypothetical protein
MKVYGDIESVNLHTGERFRRVTGNGESRLDSLGVQLTDLQRAALAEFERTMREETIPAIERAVRQRVIDAQKSRHRIIW